MVKHFSKNEQYSTMEYHKCSKTEKPVTDEQCKLDSKTFTMTSWTPILCSDKEITKV